VSPKYDVPSFSLNSWEEFTVTAFTVTGLALDAALSCGSATGEAVDQIIHWPFTAVSRARLLQTAVAI
jgi:hypothetical protein